MIYALPSQPHKLARIVADAMNESPAEVIKAFTLDELRKAAKQILEEKHPGEKVI